MRIATKLASLIGLLIGCMSTVGCSVMFPVIASIPGDKHVDPGEPVPRRAEIRVRMKDGRVVRGEYLHAKTWLTVDDSAYADRFAKAAQGAQGSVRALHPGDSLRLVTRDHTQAVNGAFVGLGDAGKPGVYTRMDNGGTAFLPASNLSGIYRTDGTAVDFAALYRGVARGILPVLTSHNTGKVSIDIGVGPLALDIDEIDRIVVPRKKHLTRAFLIGLVIDAAIVTAGLIALSNMDLSMDFTTSGRW